MVTVLYSNWKKGARDTGLTIRFKLNPNAREGTDFFIPRVANNYIVVVLNKNAIKVIPESLNLGTLDFFRMLDAGKFSDPSNKGVLDKLYMKVKRKFGIISDSDKTEILKMAGQILIHQCVTI